MCDSVWKTVLGVGVIRRTEHALHCVGRRQSVPFGRLRRGLRAPALGWVDADLDVEGDAVPNGPDAWGGMGHLPSASRHSKTGRHVRLGLALNVV